ncbi:MAG: KpsF/GutQ family sugar-phosphate isomerase [Venatoribacter sp.]
MTPDFKFNFLASAKRTITLEQQAIIKLAEHLDEQFNEACRLILACQGRVVVTGMGKSGHIGHKLAATLASTGTPAFFVHPGEASHGDMGMIQAQDVVVALSNSGETNEVTNLLPLLKRMGTKLVSITGNAQSTLAKAANAHLYAGVEQEACPLNLAPTSSTTAALVMGDALAVALLEARGFTAENFAFSHPGGALGRRLLLKVQDIMHTGDEIPVVSPETSLVSALFEITDKGLGMTTVQDKQQLVGIFTDGDLRRAIDQGIDIREAHIAQVMTKGGYSTSAETLAAEALKLMQDYKITSLLVLEQERVVGVLTMHNLLQAGVL